MDYVVNFERRDKMSINTRVLSGFMELKPHEQVEFDRIKSIIESTYHQFGFTSLDTPMIERSEVLLAKGGSETDQQIYFVTNGVAAKDPNALGLRFDLTIPLARYVAEHFNDITFPFRRCHIGKVYRGERAQKGRYREFYQCDIDVIGRGELSVRYDAEIPSIIYQIFRKLDIGKFTIRVNNRKILNGLFEELAINVSPAEVLRVIDKAEKISTEQLNESFVEIGLDQSQINGLSKFMAIKGCVADILRALADMGISNAQFCEGVSELQAVTDSMALMGVDKDYFAIDLSIARGLAYYTGTVYETILDDSPVGSICSGGRYDNLAENYTSEKLPGVGISIGLTRLFWQLRESGLINPSGKSVSDVIVLTENESNLPTAFKAAMALREAGLNVDTFYEDVNMKKKFQYVTKMNPPYVVVVRVDNESGQEVISLQYERDGELRKEIVEVGELMQRVLGK